MLQLPLQSDPRQRGGRSSRRTGEPATAASCRNSLLENCLWLHKSGRALIGNAIGELDWAHRSPPCRPESATMDWHPTTMQAPSPPPPRRKSADLALAATRLGGVGRGCGPRNSAGVGLGRRPKGSGRRGERRPPVDTERVDPAVRTIRYRLRRVGPWAAGRSRGRLELLPAGTDTMNSGRTRHERPNFAHRGWGSILMERHCR